MNYPSMVKVYRDTSYDTPQYGIHYIISNGYNYEQLRRLNLICDTITFREHYRACIGEYPRSNQPINYGLPISNEREVLFHNAPLHIVKSAGDQIASILEVVCMCPYTVKGLNVIG